MKINRFQIGWSLAIFLVVVLITLAPLRHSMKVDAHLKDMDMTGMKQLAGAVKDYVSTKHKLPPSDNGSLANELSSQHDLLNPNRNAVLILNGIIYDPWAKPYRFVISEHSVRIESSAQHYEESY
jgi:hypothetical protein